MGFIGVEFLIDGLAFADFVAHRGLERVECTFTLVAAAYNLVRMRNLIWGL